MSEHLSAGSLNSLERGEVNRLAAPFVERFWQINRSYVLFHALFSIALFFQIICFSLFFAKLAQTTLIAFCLAGIFLTIFTYLVLMFYLQARRPEKLLAVRDAYVNSCRKSLRHSANSVEMHCALAEAILLFINQLSISPSETPWLKLSSTLSELFEKFRIWTRWKDLLKMKEMLLMASIREHIELIKSNPSDLEAHSSLSSNYLALSRLYQDPRKLALNETLQWTPHEYQSEKMRHKFEMALMKALEEYQIIDGYAPNNPWVYAQRAAIYHELGQSEKESGEYEKILKVAPQNSEVLLRLGTLYFRQGQNAAGLKIYDELKLISEERAEQLISQYDAYAVEEYSFEG